MSRRIALAQAILWAALAGCNNSNGGSNDMATSGGDASVAATWTQVYNSVIVPRCAPCHTTAGGIGISQGHLDMTSKDTAFANIVNVVAAGSACAGKGTRVTPGKPDSSILYLKISLDDPAPCGTKMPQGGPALSQAQANLVESWIKANAPNN